MKANIVECLFGVLAFDEELKLFDKMVFPKKPQEAAKLLMKLEAGKIIDELANLINRLKERGFQTFVFENANLAKEIAEKLGVKVEISKPSKAGELFRSNMEKFAVEAGFVKDSAELSVWKHKIAMELAKLKVKGAVEKRDLLISQAIQTLDDLDKTLNLFMSRVREWYGIHFPELSRMIEKHETYARLVLNLGGRENFSVENLEKEGIPRSKAEQIAKAAESSMGAELAEADIKQIQSLCNNVIGLYQLRENFEDYLDKAMEEVAPNTKAIVGSLLGARLIALAGGLTNLARMPASTIQVLGAEKALFRSLKTGTRPPKHGIILQHTYLHEAKRWHRGKIARALAGKLAIAARIDAFGGRYVGEELKEDLEKRVEEIREKYAEAPRVPEKKQKHEKRVGRKRHGAKS
ncbi:MAG: C/D box methylation guide ribonucleoprotein complex aNOP56 subunit [Candidatus Bathyarchaeia archaeon]